MRHTTDERDELSRSGANGPAAARGTGFTPAPAPTPAPAAARASAGEERDEAAGWPRFWPLLLLAAAVVPGAAVLVIGHWSDAPAMRAWRTVCLAVTVQAMPFLLLGTALSGAINAFVPARVFTRVLPRRPALAVPVAGVAGVVLPGCECASVPVAGSLIGRGVT
ncbi:permease, partial [Streptomyces sp. NPDC047000]|uniref:permease n=1 Tax=Streptomyces sp. NPDC047000 TaxID=3155474 RepID=UPI0033FEBD21